jgi:hypothetical protein
MSIQVTCPAGHTLKVADDWGGRAGLCPVCKAPIQVPAALKETATNEPAHIEEPAALSPPSFNPTRPLAAPPIRTRTHSRPLPPAPPRLPSTFAHEVPTPPPVLPAEKAPPPVQSPPVAVASASAIAAAVDAALAIDEPVHDLSAVANAPRPADVVSAPTALATIAPQAPLLAPEVSNTSDGQATAPKPRSVKEPVDQSAAQVQLRPLRGYVPDADKRWTVYYLAAGMLAFSVFCLLPALRHWNLGEAPDWARAVWLTSILQLAFVAWVLSVPDWATLWVSMLAFTLVATGYGLAMAVALTTPLEQAIPLDMTDIRRQAPLWCGCVVLLAFLLAYLCGRTAWRWRKTFELVHA